jgi:hypothetical protein
MYPPVLHREEIMKRNVVAFASFAVALGFGFSANAQSLQTLSGDIASVDNAALHLKSSSGQETTIRLPDDVRVSLRVPAKLDDIKAGTFVGTAATPGSNGTLVASEVHIFPEAMRGTGEGHRSMATMPGSTMTNATVAGVSSSAADTRRWAGTDTEAQLQRRRADGVRVGQDARGRGRDRQPRIADAGRARDRLCAARYDRRSCRATDQRRSERIGAADLTGLPLHGA